MLICFDLIWFPSNYKTNHIICWALIINKKTSQPKNEWILIFRRGKKETVEEERRRWRRRGEGGGGEGGGNGEGRKAIWYKFTFPTPLLKTLQMSDIYQSVSLRFVHSCCQYRCYLCYVPHQTQQQNFAPFLCWQLLQSADTDTRINLFSRQRRSQDGGGGCMVSQTASWISKIYGFLSTPKFLFVFMIHLILI